MTNSNKTLLFLAMALFGLSTNIKAQSIAQDILKYKASTIVRESTFFSTDNYTADVSYDNQGRLLSSTFIYKDRTKEGVRHSYEYTKKDINSITIKTIETFEDGKWSKKKKEFKEYDKDNNMLDNSTVVYINDTIASRFGERYEREFHPNGKYKTLNMYLTRPNKNELLTNRQEYILDDNGEYLQYKFYVWQPSDGGWILMGRTDSLLVFNNLISESGFDNYIMYSVPPKGDEIKDYRYLSTRNSDGQLLSHNLAGWIGNEWVKSIDKTFAFDDQKNVALSTTKNYGTSTNIKIITLEYDYDLNKRPIKLNLSTVTNGVQVGSTYTETYQYTGSSITKSFPHIYTIGVYPNPATGVISLTNVPAQAQVLIINAQGKICKCINETSGLLHIDVREMSTGLYIIKATTGNQIWQGKFIKN